MSSSSLTPEQEQAVQIFSEITQVLEPLQCRLILENNGWNIDHAVNNFLAGAGVNPSDPGSAADAVEATVPSSSSSGGLARRNTATSAGARSQQSAATSAATSAAVPIPVAGVAAEAAAAAAATAGSSNPLLDTLLTPLKFLLRPRVATVNPDADARRFVQTFEQTYGDGSTAGEAVTAGAEGSASARTVPRLHSQSYSSAVLQAHRQGRFVLVYLHSPMHEDTADFCRQTFCRGAVARATETHLVTWAGSVHDVEGYSLSQQLQATAYPFLALLIARNEREVQVCDRLQGCGALSQRGLMERLRALQEAFGGELTQMLNTRRQRVESTNLRQEQDRDYLESQRQDRLRREKRENDEEEAKEKQQGEAQAQAQAQSEEARALAAATNALQAKRHKLLAKPEPVAGSSADVATIRLQMPSGLKVNRRFLKTDSVQDLRDWMDVHLADTAASTAKGASDETDTAAVTVNYSLSTAFPKTELSDATADLDSYGLHPRGMLYVVDLDL